MSSTQTTGIHYILLKIYVYQNTFKHLNTRNILVHENAHSQLSDQILHYSWYTALYTLIHVYVCKQKQLLCMDLNNVIILRQTVIKDRKLLI